MVMSSGMRVTVDGLRRRIRKIVTGKFRDDPERNMLQRRVFYALKNAKSLGEDNVKIVHGTIKRPDGMMFGHAWVKITSQSGSKIGEPQSNRDKSGKPP